MKPRDEAARIARRIVLTRYPCASPPPGCPVCRGVEVSLALSIRRAQRKAVAHVLREPTDDEIWESFHDQPMSESLVFRDYAAGYRAAIHARGRK